MLRGCYRPGVSSEGGPRRSGDGGSDETREQPTDTRVGPGVPGGDGGQLGIGRCQDGERVGHHILRVRERVPGERPEQAGTSLSLKF